jgi:hypothetical protein
MALKGTRVYVRKGLNRGAFGLVTHSDIDSLRILTDDGIAVYDRIDNITRDTYSVSISK